MTEPAGGYLFSFVRLPPAVTDALGVAGIALYIGAYLLLQLGLIRSDRWPYPAANFFASFFLFVSLTQKFNPYSMTNEIAWMTISLIGLGRLYIVHRYYRFTEEERTAVARLAPGLGKDRARKLLSCGTWSDVAAGHVLTRQGTRVTHLVYIASGQSRVEIDGAGVALAGAGELIGELTYNTSLPATATVVTNAPSRILAFEREVLEGFLRRNPDVAAVLEQSIAGDLRQKLAATTRTLAAATSTRGDPAVGHQHA